MHETRCDANSGRHGNCRSTISGPRNHDTSRQPDHRSICTRPLPGIHGGSEKSQVSVKAEPVAEHNEFPTHGNTPSAPRAPVRLAKLLRGLEGAVVTKPNANTATPHGDLEILEIAYDSRRVKRGTLFVAIRGEKIDGNNFVSDVCGSGAAAIVSERQVPATISAEFPWIQ